MPTSNWGRAHAGSLKSLNLEACPIRRLPAQLSGAQLTFHARPAHALCHARCKQAANGLPLRNLQSQLIYQLFNNGVTLDFNVSFTAAWA